MRVDVPIFPDSRSLLQFFRLSSILIPKCFSDSDARRIQAVVAHAFADQHLWVWQVESIIREALRRAYTSLGVLDFGTSQMRAAHDYALRLIRKWMGLDF